MRVSPGRIVLIVGVIIAVAAIAWSLMPRPVEVEIAMVTAGRFTATVDEDGKARVRERYLVAAPLAGRSGRIQLKVGDHVAIGDVITLVQPSPAPLLDRRARREAEERVGAAEAARERTRAVVERANAQATQALTDLERTRTLVRSGASTVQALERADLAMRVAERDLRAAEFQDHATEHELNQARALLARHDQDGETTTDLWKVRAPVAGVILKVLQESETIVMPGTPLVEIGDPSDLELVVDVLSTDAVEIKSGAEVLIDRWGGPTVLAGRVRRIEPAAFTKISTLGVEEQRVNVLIDVVSPPQSWVSLGDGYRVEARIVVFNQDNAIVAPTGALFRTGTQWQAYVVSGNRVERRMIEVLRRSGRLAAIAKGLSAGEAVIIYPSDRVKPRISVKEI